MYYLCGYRDSLETLLKPVRGIFLKLKVGSRIS